MPIDSAELEKLERGNPDGLSAQQIVEFFAPRGVKLAEATFRKYVQLGLLPRSKRVGEKGKHRGSHGVYPPGTARRIASIKDLMDQGMTLEEIRRSAVYFRGKLDVVEQGIDGLLAELDVATTQRKTKRKELEAILSAARKAAAVLVKQLERAGHDVAALDKP